MLEFMFGSEFERTLLGTTIATIQVRAFVCVTHFATPGRFDPFKSIVDPPTGHEFEITSIEEYDETSKKWIKAFPDVEAHFQDDSIRDHIYDRIDQERGSW